MMKKNKVLFFIFLIMGFQTMRNTSYAQQIKNCDLSLKIISPVNDSIYSVSDTVGVFLMVKNNGPDAISINDTINFSFLFVQSSFPLDSLPVGDSTILGPIASISVSGLAPNEVDTQGFCSQLENTESSTFIDSDSSNDKNCTTFYFKEKNTSIHNIPEYPIKMYPNPSDNGFVTIKDNILNGSNNTTVVVYDLLGRVVMRNAYTNIINNKTLTIDVSSLVKGIYVVKLTTGSTQRQGKLIIR